MNPIQNAADLLWRWADQVDATHAAPGTVETMRAVATDARAEYARLQKSPGAALDALLKAWAARELARLPRGPWGEWIRTGVISRSLQVELAGLPESVAALVGAHVADEISVCEHCKRIAPCRLLESDWRCAWGCPAPAGVDPVVEWARGAQ